MHRLFYPAGAGMREKISFFSKRPGRIPTEIKRVLFHQTESFGSLRPGLSFLRIWKGQGYLLNAIILIVRTDKDVETTYEIWNGRSAKGFMFLIDGLGDT